MKLINEKSSASLTAAFRDNRGRLQVPTAITYRVDCLTTGSAVKPWTAIDPANSVEIALTANENSIFNDSNPRERRLVTIVAAYSVDSDDQVTDDFTYEVRNLAFVS